MTIDTQLALGIVSCLGHSWPEKVFCDITVAIDGQEFKCHRFHLSACSEFFRVLLGSNLSLDYLIIKGISPDIFELILDSIYKGEIRITADNMIDLWYAANQLEIRFLLEEIENFIISNISNDNYLHIFDVAHDLKAARVLTGVCEALIVNWEKFRQDHRFLTLSCEELQTIIQNANTISSDELVESILIWTNYEFTAPIKNNIQNFPFSKGIDDDNKFVEVTLKSTVNLDISDKIIDYNHLTSINRKEIIGKLLENVKLDLISLQGLKKLLCDDTVMDCKEARDLVRKALASSLERTYTTAAVPETPQSNESKVDGLMPCVLFFDWTLQLKAFSFNSNTFYSLKLIFSKWHDDASLTDHFVIENNLYVVINYLNPVPYRVINKISPDWTSETIYSFKTNYTEIVIGCGNFLYRFINHLRSVTIVRCKLGSQVWNEVGKFDKTGEISCVFCFRDIILVYVSENNKTESFTHFYYFDTTERISRL
ncbi:unnamed protein product [Lymnaea stagnalis]|uniref:BTB domain-containing protein n=1 Tax=Lymnaea stagnalis TaxID=6523 RepID=A0AAV2I6C0_LYMST